MTFTRVDGWVQIGYAGILWHQGQVWLVNIVGNKSLQVFCKIKLTETKSEKRKYHRHLKSIKLT